VTTSRRESQSRSLLVACTITTLVGIALCTGDNQELGSWVTLAGLLGLIFSVHRFGRLGPEPPIERAGDHSAKSEPL
jgi:hypothetical protein